MAAIFAISLNEPALISLLYGWAGPVGLDIKRRAENVATKARENASGGVVQMRTGNLADSIYVEPKRIGPEAGQSVGTDLPYGRYLEEGTPPHPIEVRYAEMLWSDDLNPDPLRKWGLKRVDHPGVPAFKHRWLRPALEEAAN